jgi:hypothetical protein
MSKIVRIVDGALASDRPWRWIAGLGICCVLGWIAFVKDDSVPILSLIDLAFHEFGHFATYVFSEPVTAIMGSVAQVAFPLAIAGYFAFRMLDWLAAALCLAWAGTSAQNASVYIADAPYEELELLGGEHDWAYLLGPEVWNRLDQAESIARTVDTLGVLMLLAGVAICVLAPLLAPGRTRPG